MVEKFRSRIFSKSRAFGVQKLKNSNLVLLLAVDPMYPSRSIFYNSSVAINLAGNIIKKPPRALCNLIGPSDVSDYKKYKSLKYQQIIYENEAPDLHIPKKGFEVL